MNTHTDRKRDRNYIPSLLLQITVKCVHVVEGSMFERDQQKEDIL